MSADERAKNKNLANSVSVNGQIVLIPVLYSDNFFCSDIEPRFFLDFLDGIFTDGNIDVNPAARERPFSVVLSDKENFSALKNSRSRVELRSLIACFVAEKIFYLVDRNIRFVGNNFCRNFSDTLKSLNVVGVLAVGQARLCKALQFDCPIEPSHIFIHDFHSVRFFQCCRFAQAHARTSYILKNSFCHFRMSFAGRIQAEAMSKCHSRCAE